MNEKYLLDKMWTTLMLSKDVGDVQTIVKLWKKVIKCNWQFLQLFDSFILSIFSKEQPREKPFEYFPMIHGW
jgi:hypothetical protein